MAFNYGYTSGNMDTPEYYGDDESEFLNEKQIKNIRYYFDSLCEELYGEGDLDPYWIDECLSIIGDEIGRRVPKGLPLLERKQKEKVTELQLAANLIREFI